MSYAKNRPIHRPRQIGPSIWRVPDHGYVTPRLREERRDLSLIGFHHRYVEADPPDDDNADAG